MGTVVSGCVGVTKTLDFDKLLPTYCGGGTLNPKPNHIRFLLAMKVPTVALPDTRLIFLIKESFPFILGSL